MDDLVLDDQPAFVSTWMRNAWTGSDFPEQTLGKIPALERMDLAAGQSSDDPPAEVLHYWHFLIAQERLRLYRAESSFISCAHGSGWSWASIGEALGISTEEAEKRPDDLSKLMEQFHPSSGGHQWSVKGFPIQ